MGEKILFVYLCYKSIVLFFTFRPMKIITKFTACALTMSMFLFASCEKETYYPQEGSDAPRLSDFSTTQQVELNLNYQVPTGFVAVFDLYAENPYEANFDNVALRKDVTPIASGISVSGLYEYKKSIPAYVSELYLYSPSLFVPELMKASIVNGVASFEAVDLNVIAGNSNDLSSRSVASGAGPDGYLRSGKNSTIVGTSKDVNSNGRPNYISKTESLPAAVMTAISTTFVDTEKADETYYNDACMYLKQEAEVWVAVISSAGTYNSSLSYFCYTNDMADPKLGEKVDFSDFTATQRKAIKEVVAFPKAKVGTGRNELKNNEYVQLKYYDAEKKAYVDKFPAGTTIGWILRADAYSSYSTTINTSKPVYYSVPKWNPEKQDANKNHTIVFTAEYGNKEYICFGFEDMPNEEISGTGPGDADCNDVMFHVITNPERAIDPPPHIPVEGVTTTTEVNRGMLLFEDLWPWHGDYDMNDLVVSYTNSSVIAQATLDGIADGPAKLTKLTGNVSLLHWGGDYNNAFSCKVNLNPSDVSLVTLDGQNVTMAPDGNGFIIHICKDLSEALTAYAHSVPKTYDYSILLAGEGIVHSGNVGELFNPYIRPMDGKEVHLPYFAPTENANMDYFNTSNDKSIPSKGVWYVSNESCNYAWALHLSGVVDFVIPTEMKTIDCTYPKYKNWVESGCSRDVDSDWYLYPAN